MTKLGRNINPNADPRAIRRVGFYALPCNEMADAGGHKGLPYGKGWIPDPRFREDVGNDKITVGSRRVALCHSRERGNPEIAVEYWIPDPRFREDVGNDKNAVGNDNIAVRNDNIAANAIHRGGFNALPCDEGIKRKGLRPVPDKERR